ncbi:hypothetical protein I553_10696 [Mycobacterium xenopi 4042]|uniref:Uncharacterized protein n=1 Tax=Mycobacterium xenopi 4042 TaxID=1299334 RepID=X8DAM3_MYCXE|nr:hypothetical protein I553_10696 [Mycobacterium xenopi 4042]
MAVTNARIADSAVVCVRIVQTARRILAAAGWAMEASRGYGHAGGRRNRPSVWHLVSRRTQVCALPSRSSYQRVCHAGKNSPSGALGAAGKITHQPKIRDGVGAHNRPSRATYTPNAWRRIWPRTASVCAQRTQAAGVMFCSAAIFDWPIGPATSWFRR